MTTEQQPSAPAPFKTDPRARYMDVTPAFARAMLAPEINSRNRKIIASAVAFYADAMENDEWAVTGEPIQFAGQLENTASLTLLGGQHRLEAIALTGITQRMLVVDELDPDVFAVLDTGKTRGFKDVLSAMGEPDASKVAAAARLAYLVEHGLITSSSPPKVSNLRLQAWVTDHIDFTSHNNEASSIRKIVPINQSAVLVALWSLTHIDKNAATEFFEGIRTGANLGTGDPRLALRNWLIRNGKDERAHVHLAMIYKAWNGYRTGRPVHVLRWSPSPPTRELFPQPAP